MTRTEFPASQTFFRWLENRKRPYEIYYTRRRVIAVPTVSTRPVIYGIYDFQNDRESVLNDLEKHVHEDDIYALKDFNFDETQAENDE